MEDDTSPFFDSNLVKWKCAECGRIHFTRPDRRVIACVCLSTRVVIVDTTEETT